MRLVRRLLILATACYWLLIFTLTHIPPNHMPHVPASDKLEHFCAYMGLCFLLGATLWLVWPARRRVLPLVVIGAAMAYGAFDEISQIPVGRDCELNDWFADVGGAAAAGAALYAAQVYVARRARSRAAASAASDTPLAIESA